MENTETLLEPDSPATRDTQPKGSNKTWVVILVLVVILAAIITGIILLASAPEDTTTFVRDIFIILMALISIVIGAALVVLVIQIAALINLLQNEIKPILESTSETVNTLKGTTTFLSNNLTEPVIKFNSSVAGVRKLLSLLSMFKK